MANGGPIIERTWGGSDAGVRGSVMRQGPERSLELTEQAFADSPLRRLDPRWKLAAVALLLTAVALLRTLPAAAAALTAP